MTRTAGATSRLAAGFTAAFWLIRRLWISYPQRAFSVSAVTGSGARTSSEGKRFVNDFMDAALQRADEVSASARIEAPGAGAERDELEQSAGDCQVLQEMDELVLVAQIAMEAEGGGDTEHRERRSRDARLVAGDERETAEELDGNGERIGELRQRQAGRGDVADRARGGGEFADDRNQEDDAEENPADEGQRCAVLTSVEGDWNRFR